MDQQQFTHDFITFVLHYEVLQFGNFTLKSGRKSPYFFNLGAIASGEALQQLGLFYARAITKHLSLVQTLFGPAYKGIPIASATAIALAYHYQMNVAVTFNRKETKLHGEGGKIMGAPLMGNIVLIDDVITAGTAIRDAMELIKDSPAKIIGVQIALDRQEMGFTKKNAIQELADQYQLPIFSLITFEDIINYLSISAEKNNEHYKILKTLQTHQKHSN